ncbi:MAG: type II toxin-antitoxin system PrlF family antitoxin [Candidatus Marinimicrobia bacterium]|nr:type II toxin-antitoxin system PrlF family antitoxin [Candidatus Neomarinimicrobiota bacterium]
MKATITSKGQVTIPKPVRDFMHIGKSDTIDFEITDSGKVFIKVPQQSITRLGGLLSDYKQAKPLTDEQMDESIQTELYRQVKP